MTKRGIWVFFMVIGVLSALLIKLNVNIGPEIMLYGAGSGIAIGMLLTKILGICGCKIELGTTHFHVDCSKCERLEK